MYIDLYELHKVFFYAVYHFYSERVASQYPHAEEVYYANASQRIEVFYESVQYRSQWIVSFFMYYLH